MTFHRMRIPTMKLAIVFLLFANTLLLSDIIPPDRRIDWSPGLPGGFPEKTVQVNVMDFGAVGDGQTDDSDAFINAIKAIPSSGGELNIPAGSYLITKKLAISKGVLFKGESFDETRLLFDLGKRGDNCIEFVKYDRGDWVDVEEGFEKGSNELIVQNPSKFKAGDFVEIQQENDPDLMYTDDNWKQSWSENAVGQILKIESIRDDGTLVLNRPLYMTYRAELAPQLRTLGLIEFPGVEDLYIERLDAGDGHTIQMRYVAYGRVQRIESNMTYRTHVYLSECYATEVSNNYIHHSHDYGGGGHGYGVDTVRHTTDCLIIDNIFHHLRHSMLTHVGTSGNVFAYNYSPDRDPQRLTDISLHGHYSNYNLFESNVVQEIQVADYWGPMGPGNTFLRNKVEDESFKVDDFSHYQNVVGNEILKGLSIESNVQHTLNHGNIVRGKVVWDDAISDRDIPVSYFLTDKPDFFHDSPWPLFGPDVDGDLKLPAQRRYESGDPISTVNDNSAHVPLNYQLSVYPNPFNPQTSITFDLPAAGHVQVDVYSMHGRWIETLVDDKRSAGQHTVNYQPSALMSSGVYVVRVSAGSITLHKKVTYLK